MSFEVKIVIQGIQEYRENMLFIYLFDENRMLEMNSHILSRFLQNSGK